MRPFWKERQAWLDATMPEMGDAGQAHSTFLEHLQSTARQARSRSGGDRAAQAEEDRTTATSPKTLYKTPAYNS
jgi:hypothetical protein